MEQVALSQEDAVNDILRIRGEIWASGNVDREMELLNTFITEMKDGKITPEQAVEKANILQNGRIER